MRRARGNSNHAHNQQRLTSSASNVAYWSGSRARLHNARERTTPLTRGTANVRRTKSAKRNKGAYIGIAIN